MNKISSDRFADGSLRPYEQVERYGAATLSDAQLLAVILRTGTNGTDSIELAKKVLASGATHEGLIGLYQMSIPELMQIKGIGRVKAIQISCICELSKRMAARKREKTIDFSSPKAVAYVYMEQMRHEERERVIIVMLDAKCQLIKDEVLTIGTVNCSLVTPREILIEALKYRAVSFIVLHNHPSGDPSPSQMDYRVTKRLKTAGELVGVRLTDHIVIGDASYYSFQEDGFFNDQKRPNNEF